MMLFRKLESFPKLHEFAFINRGLITGDRNKYFTNNKVSDKHVPILTGSDIKKYHYLIPSEYVLFERPKTAGGCWDKNVHFADHKICVRQIGNEPIATLIDEKFAVTGNIFTVIPKNLSISKVFLGIINSNLIKYYWSIMFSDFKKSFPQVTIYSLSQIPIFGTTEHSEMTTLVNQILAAKKADPQSNTSTLEAEINRLVYELYGLTDEEIRIVEGNTDMIYKE
ncbi:MAG: TaqI-like C-terminal specificity domain-containing protein [Candidatus Marinimicrobia bacterium]|nr:TaqI-like C-terminal specificity domain-containing protein [Candidatus Neomarinimicrobiota bacterium]